jgi:hypothetical protein
MIAEANKQRLSIVGLTKTGSHHNHALKIK